MFNLVLNFLKNPYNQSNILLLLCSRANCFLRSSFWNWFFWFSNASCCHNQKHPLEMFCKKVFLNRKKSVLEYLFNKVAEIPTQIFSCEICKIFKTICEQWSHAYLSDNKKIAVHTAVTAKEKSHNKIKSSQQNKIKNSRQKEKLIKKKKITKQSEIENSQQ